MAARREVFKPGSLRMCVASCLLAGAALASNVQAEDLPNLAALIQSGWTYNTSQEFLAGGLSRAENVRVAQWADDISSRHEGFLRMSFPTEITQALRIHSGTNDISGGIDVVKEQGWMNSRLYQQLYLRRAHLVHREDALEGLTWLLVNQQLIARQTRSQRRQGLAETPDWLSVGIAQNAYSDLRSRNSELVLNEWEHVPSISKILQFDVLPEGRWLEKAACGVVLAWLHDLPASRKCFEKMFQRLVDGETITAEWMAQTLFQFEDVASLEKSWDLWIASQDSIKRKLGQVTPGKISDLERVLVIHPDNMGFAVEDELPEELSLFDLVAYRTTDSAQRIARWLNVRLQSMAVGEPPAFRDVVMAYADACQQIAEAKKKEPLAVLRKGKNEELMLSVRRAVLAHEAFLSSYRGGAGEEEENAYLLATWREMQRTIPQRVLDRTRGSDPADRRVM